jgi:hypothetical protein
MECIYVIIVGTKQVQKAKLSQSDTLSNSLTDDKWLYNP